VWAAVVPDWLAEVVRPKPAPLPWQDMIRAALAICVPLSVAFAVGRGTIGVLPAMGGLMGTMSDTGGSYVNRVKRVTAAAVLGGAAGLAIGAVIHGHGWIAVLALVLVAGVSGAVSALGDIGSATGLQLLVYCGLGLGPLGVQRPVWHTVAGFVVGAAWALILILPGWLLSPHGQEQRDVAAVYTALAAELGSASDGFPVRRQAVTGALSTAYDTLLRGRSTAAGRSREAMRLIALLNASHPMAEAAQALGMAGTPPPAEVVATVAALADAIRSGTPPPVIPPAWDDSPGALALHDAMAVVARVLSSGWAPQRPGREPLRGRFARSYSRSAGVLDRLVEEFGGGTLTRLFTVRLMICIGVAGVVTEVLPLQRSYWVPLTVALVLKPDYGSVFARALQRGIGTIVGAVAGAVLLALIHGTWLLIPFAVLAALLPYGRKRNYGLMTTFLTPLVVVLIDLLSPTGWRLAEDRLIDSLIGCAIALVIGFAPWPMSWYAHLPREFAAAALDVARYMEEALGVPSGRGAAGVRVGVAAGGGDGGAAGGGDGGSAGRGAGRVPVRARTRWAAYRALADVRTEFQRTMAEPPSISRRATAWYPALVGLERVMDATAATALSVRQSGVSVPPGGVRQLTGALRAVSEAAATGTPIEKPPELPEDEVLKPVTGAVRALLGVVGSGRSA
jgi:Fusaric acid resistance protein-like/FUSC-like inner membrane protein yccS